MQRLSWGNLFAIFRASAIALALTMLGASARAWAEAQAPHVEPAQTVHGYRTTLSPDFRPETLPLSILETEKEYLETRLPIAMVVSQDAEYATYWYCDGPDACEYDLAESIKEVVEYCETLSLGDRCFVHSIGRDRMNPSLTYVDSIAHTVVEAEEAIRHGPDKAVGKVIYLPGFSGWDTERPNIWPKPTDGRISPLMHALNDRGWDIDVVNILHYARYMFWDRDAMYAGIVNGVAEAARKQGYARVVVIGSSRGGSEAMRAAVEGASVDGVVLIEPDWHGPKHQRDGSQQEDHGERKARDLGRYLKKVRAPRLAYAFFHKSDWFNDVSVEDMAEALRDFSGAVFMLGKPEGYTGHFAAASPRFAREYGGCLHAFLIGEAEGPEDCALPELDPENIANWTSMSQITAAAKPVSGAELLDVLAEGRVCPYDFVQGRVRTDLSCATFEDGRRTVDAVPFARRPTRFVSEIEYTEGGYCKVDAFSAQTTDRGCLNTYRAGDFFIFQRTDNDAVFIYHYVADREDKPADFVCHTGTDGFACVATK